MDQPARREILSMSSTAHGMTELSYQQNPALPGDPGWVDKQRILLADMALHLLQTALKDGELSEEGLKRNLFSILAISDELVRGYGLKAFADKLYDTPCLDAAGAR